MQRRQLAGVETLDEFLPLYPFLFLLQEFLVFSLARFHPVEERVDGEGYEEEEYEVCPVGGIAHYFLELVSQG
jgi:hypothetical protein